jgi:ankyrin repeat protein
MHLSYRQDGHTALHYACQEGHVEVVRSILARHPRIDAKTKVSIYFNDILVLHPTADQAEGRSVEV